MKFQTEAVAEEMSALNKQEIWDLVDQLEDQNLDGLKWVYKIKWKADNTFYSYKPHLMAWLYTRSWC